MCSADAKKHEFRKAGTYNADSLFADVEPGCSLGDSHVLLSRTRIRTLGTVEAYHVSAVVLSNLDVSYIRLR